MPFECEAPESMEGQSNFLKHPGNCHLVIDEIEEDPKGAPGGIKLHCICLAHDVKSEATKTVGVLLGPPKQTHKDKGEFARRVICRALVAMGHYRPRDIQPGMRIVIESFKPYVGAQLFATLKDTDDHKFINLDGDRIFHVDDPAAAKFPRDEAALKLLPESARRRPEEFSNGKATDQSASSESTGQTPLNVDEL